MLSRGFHLLNGKEALLKKDSPMNALGLIVRARHCKGHQLRAISQEMFPLARRHLAARLADCMPWAHRCFTAPRETPDASQSIGVFAKSVGSILVLSMRVIAKKCGSLCCVLCVGLLVSFFLCCVIVLLFLSCICLFVVFDLWWVVFLYVFGSFRRA